MTKEEIYIRGCLYAVDELIEKGSSKYTVKNNGKWVTVSWDEITDWLVSNLDIIDARKQL